MLNWEYGVVSFIDILGFSSIVESDARKLDPQNLQRIQDGLNEARELHKESNIEILSFSDSIILSTTLENQNILNIFDKTLSIQKGLFSRKILTRGGIAFGKHHQDNKTLYSEALIKAYKLETERAKFPRVIIEQDLLDWLTNDRDTNAAQLEKSKETMLTDKDGEVFLDYLSENLLETSLDLLKSAIDHKFKAGILEKYQWLDSYHNHKCSPDHTQLICQAYSQGFTKI